MGRASENFLAEIHGLVADGIRRLIESDDPRERAKGLEMAMKFLKDNGITTRIEASEETQQLQKVIEDSTVQDLENLMRLTPDDV